MLASLGDAYMQAQNIRSLKLPQYARGSPRMGLDASFDLEPGDIISRKQLHKRFGGIVQGGISPSLKAKAIFLFTEPGAAAEFGYHDRWNDGLFHYTGTGQSGDQRLTGLNGSVLKHRAQGRALHVFHGSRGAVKYAGEFELESHYTETRNDARGRERRVIVFRLRRVT